VSDKPAFSTTTRRKFFARTAALGFAPVALQSIQADDVGRSSSSNFIHHRPKATSTIFLHMIGGPSQIDLFDPKPEVIRRDGETLPESVMKQLTFAQIQEKQPVLMGSPWKFEQRGQSGAVVSELLPFTAGIVDDLAIVRTVRTDDTNHMFAELLLNTGSRKFGHPSIGSWVVYGLGSENRNLPHFIVLRSGMRPRSKGANYSSGFLPSRYQGTAVRDAGPPILNLESPEGITMPEQRKVVSAVQQLNQLQLDKTGDADIDARIASYETAFRMQTAAPEAFDLAGESAETLNSYGITNPAQPSYARNCVLARRLVERGVRFVHLFHGDWDHHSNITAGLPQQCQLTDQPTAALIRDLKRRGLLDQTLVVWGGELGRTPVAQKSDKPDVPVGRDHQIEAFTMWLAGGGVRGGRTIGETHELGCLPVTESWHVHDLQATILHHLGIDHRQLTYRFLGRDFRLTDVGGNVREL
jgi:hypothetical protein